MKHIWNLACKKVSLWVIWISTVILRGRNIWEVNADSSDSWGWRNLLEIRVEISKSVWHKLVNSESTSLWFDNWSDICP